MALYQKTCDSGNAKGCTYLGVAYANGEGGLPRDLVRSVALFKKACEGDALGCHLLGVNYADGTGGLSKDLVRAVALFKRACDGGDTSGCSDLGVAYANGVGGLPKDLVRAAALLKRACDAGYAEGCANLGNTAGQNLDSTQPDARSGTSLSSSGRIWTAEDVKRSTDRLVVSGSFTVPWTATYNAAPRYYKGPVPFSFSGTSTYVLGIEVPLSQEYAEWRTDYIYADIPSALRKIPDGARTVDKRTGALMAEARRLPGFRGDGFDIEEFHYNGYGAVVFSCISRISVALGEKVGEAQASGNKVRDYYFRFGLK